MLFSFVVFLMVVLIGAFWAYQGFFSALLMFFESLIACMLAFGFFEVVAGLIGGSLGGPGIELPLSFMAVFLASLGLMRVATDKLIRDSVHLPLPVDRAGAGVAGFFAGMIIVGTTLTAIQMFPIGSGVFGFERYSTSASGQKVRHGLGMVRPDDFVCALAGMLSNDRFGGDVRLRDAKPDYIDLLYSSRAVPMSEEPILVKASDVKVNAVWMVNEIDLPKHELEGDTLIRSFQSEGPSRGGNVFFVCNVSVAKNSSGPVGKGEIRFRLPQFRLVGPPQTEDGPSVHLPTSLFMATGMTDIYTHRKLGPISVTGEQRQRLAAFGPTTDFVLGESQTKIVEDGESWRFDVAFEVPDDFRPWYLEFKRGGKVDLTTNKKFAEWKNAEKCPPPSYASRPQGTGGQQGKVVKEFNTKVGTEPGGTLHVANAIEERTDATDLVPIPLDKNDPAVAKYLSQGMLGGNEECQFWTAPKPYVLQAQDKVEKFWVPDDKRMIQIGAEVLKQNSMYSRAIGFANRVLGQTKITDDTGKDYFAVGFYVAAEIDGLWKIEVQYNPTSEQPERALKQPTHIKHSAITKAGPDNVKFGFLFVVDPGVKIVSFSPGGKGKTQSVNLQAPN